VSRWHARLHREADRWVLADTGSTNGTRVNGWRVRRPVPVQPGDHVMFGSAVFIVCASER
jgi:pSer/pThr/pTyr-binding forkhead associated (FHA) protein